jgi:predicted NACHT family NTPase
MIGANKLSEIAVRTLVYIFIETAVKNVGLLKNLSRQIIFDASQKYVKNYTERHGVLRVLGMREPVPLESVYTTVQFLNNRDIRRFESVENLEQAFRINRGFQPKNYPKKDGLQVANDKQYLMVLGGPGVGKSTFLRKMGLEALKGEEGNFLHQCIPVFIELKNINPKQIDIEAAIIEEFSICGFPCPQEATISLLEKGKLLILLDGLDEVPTKIINQAIDALQNFCDKYSQNRFIISCRTAAYRNNFRRYTDVSMAEFDNTQIQEFIGNWFHSQEDKQLGTAQRCWDILQKSENTGARELANTPLLLTFLCLVYDHSQNFPNNRSSLYKKALRILLEEWAAEKRIMREEIYRGLNTDLQEILLAEIAYTGFAVDQLFFHEDDIGDKIQDFLSSNLNAPKHLNCKAILNAMAVQQGILVERVEDIFSFCHLTFQEYLTAQYIIDHHLIENFVLENILDKRWQEVFLLVAGLMRSGSDSLLSLMQKEAQKHINTPKLQGLLRWSEEVTSCSSRDFSQAGKRATAIFLATARDSALYLTNILSPNLANILEITRMSKLAAAINPDYNHTINYSRRPSNIATTRSFINALNKALNRAIADELTKLKILPHVDFYKLMVNLQALRRDAPGNLVESYKAHQGFNNRVANIWFQALGLDSELLSLSPEESQALENYFYINILMVRCKQAAVRVSPKTWETIEQQMLSANVVSK